jgi:hypothetical protein
MRFLLFILLSSVSLLAQDAPTSSDKYIWAKAGLVLRTEGSPKGEKIAVIPYGASVQLTGEWGEDLSIEIVPERELDGEELPGWEMLGQFVGIRYGELKGFAFNGYISSYNPADFVGDILNDNTKSGFEVIDTLHYLRFHQEPENGEVSVLFRNGVTENSYWDKSGGGGTIVMPNATLASGYLFAAKWFDLDVVGESVPEWRKPQLVSSTPDSLTFRIDLLEVTIKEYFGVVIIVYDAHC